MFYFCLGLVVYFGYSIRHSSERVDSDLETEGYLILQSMTPTESIATLQKPLSSNGETVALITKGDKK